MSRTIVSGSVAYDRIMDHKGLFADHFVPDKIRSINLSFVVEKMEVKFGGTAGNLAYNLSLLGEQADIISSAGYDFDPYRIHLQGMGIDPATIHLNKDDLTSLAVVFTDKHNNQISAFYEGAGAAPYGTPVPTEGRVFAFISPGCMPDMTSLPGYYREKKLPYAFDPSQQLSAMTPDALRNGLTGAAMLFSSDYEFSLIMKKTGWTESQILERVPTLVITYGSEGSRIITKDGKWGVPAALSGEIVDPTGAGDGFRAGFLKGMYNKLSFEQCARLGSVIASYVIEKYGTQSHHFTMADVAERYKASYGEQLSIA